MNWFSNLYERAKYCDLEETGNSEVTKVSSNFSSQTVRELRALARERVFFGFSKLRKAELVVLLENTEMERAARRGCIDLVKLCRRRGATAFGRAMRSAALGGHIEIIELCRLGEQRILTALCLRQPMEVIWRLSNCVERWEQRILTVL